tara:strand:+ start:734 stop:1039 length:306 start_codon:yes stop_codon:yes gene_type:complete
MTIKNINKFYSFTEDNLIRTIDGKTPNSRGSYVSYFPPVGNPIVIAVFFTSTKRYMKPFMKFIRENFNNQEFIELINQGKDVSDILESKGYKSSYMHFFKV